MGISAVIFDCDGMVVDSERVSDRLMSERGASDDAFRDFFSSNFQQCLVGSADLKEELRKVMTTWGWQTSAEELLAFWFDPEHNRIDERFRSIIDTLRARGIGVYVATNNEKYRTADLMKTKGLRQWFDEVFSSSAIGTKKPEAAFFEHVVAAIGLPKEEILYWDDEAGHVEVARALGLKAEQYVSFEDFTHKMQTLF